jgi:lipoyl-dependent peroxiredoxin
MSLRKAKATWNGKLKDGNGTLEVESGLFKDAPYSFKSRFEQGTGTNPEELIGAAHAGCFSMAFSGILEKNGYNPERVSTTAEVEIGLLGGDYKITKITLSTEGKVPGIEKQVFYNLAKQAKENCPVSRALAATAIEFKATLR